MDPFTIVSAVLSLGSQFLGRSQEQAAQKKAALANVLQGLKNEKGSNNLPPVTVGSYNQPDWNSLISKYISLMRGG